MKKKAIVVASFGTSVKSAYKTGILPVVESISRYFMDYRVIHSYTSRMIIRKLKEERGILIDTPYDAVSRLCAECYNEIYVLPSHIIPGIEYEKICKDILDVKKHYPDSRIVVGKALLQEDKDFEEITAAFRDELELLSPDKALVIMGHGTRHFAHAAYFRFLYEMNRISKHVFFTAVENTPDFSEVTRKLTEGNYKSAVLKSLMITAGDHVLNDMASDNKNSLKSRLTAAGISCECRVAGLGTQKTVQHMLIRHLETLF